MTFISGHCEHVGAYEVWDVEGSYVINSFRVFLSH